MSSKSLMTIVSLVAGITILAFLVSSRFLTEVNARVIGVVFVTIVLWATSVVPGLLVSLLFFLMAVTLTDVPTSEIFAGFSSSAFWLVFSGTVIGFALNESGLNQRIGVNLARIVGGSYLGALIMFAVLAFSLSLVMPSTFGRIAILVPLALGYCSVAGLDRSRRGYSGIVLLVVVGSYALAAAVLPANLPNLIMAGALEQREGITLGYFEYLYYFFPAGVLLRGSILVAVSFFFFPDKIKDFEGVVSSVSWSREEKYTLTLMLSMLLLWFTDGMHHIAPGWVGLGFATVYFLFASKKLDRFTSSLKIDLLWFIAAVIGVASLVGHLDDAFLAGVLNGPVGDSGTIYVYMTSLSLLLSSFVTSNAAPALFVPMAGSVLHDTVHLKMGMLSQVMGYSTTVMPYQSPPIVFGIELAKARRSDAIRYCLISGFFGIILVIPANALWWKFLGLLAL